jgi:hypothetical protein
MKDDRYVARVIQADAAKTDAAQAEVKSPGSPEPRGRA